MSRDLCPLHSAACFDSRAGATRLLCVSRGRIVGACEGPGPGREMRRLPADNEFYYLTGLTVPGAYALPRPSRRAHSVYVPTVTPGAERSEAPSLGREDHAELSS